MDLIFETKIRTREIIVKELLQCAEKIDEDIKFYEMIKDYGKIEKCINNKKNMIATAHKLQIKILSEMF